MLEYYAQIKLVHVGAVLLSGGLFLLRGLAVQVATTSPAGRLAMAAPVRFFSYGVDSILLTAALLLATILPAAMFANGWLLAKLGLLPVYVLLGTLALKRGRTPAIRRACFLAALFVFAGMLAIARTHHPLGPLR